LISLMPVVREKIADAVARGPWMKKSRMRGLQLQTAMARVAEGKLANNEIAKQLHVRLSALAQAMDEPYFARRVEEMRRQAVVAEEFRQRTQV
jgi:membrane protein YdbS with pleckstrin-like domain